MSTAVKPAQGAPIAFNLAPAMSPCMPPLDSGLVSLPAQVVAAQPPPSISVSAVAATFISLKAPGASVSLTQWGFSPFNETAGLNALVYAAPPALSDLSLALTAAAAQALSNAPARRLARALGVTALDAVLAATGGTSAASAAQAALTDPSKGGTPRATTAIDLLPDRPLDSRVLSVRVTDSAGKAVDLSRGVFPVSVTVPFRDLSIVKWNAALKTATVDVGNSGFAQPTISVMCPVSPAAATKGIVATYIRGGSGAAVVTLENVLLASYTGVIGSVSSLGSAGALSSMAAPNGASVTTDLFAVSRGGAGSGANVSLGSLLSAQAPTVSSEAYTYTLSTDCGPAFRKQTFVCGAGFAGTAITFACPAVVATPSCLRYNASARGWASGGCSVASSSITSVVCTCDAPGDIAVRFAALTQQQIDIFAAGSPATASSTLPIWVGLFALLGVTLGLNVIGVVCARDAVARDAWTRRLAADAEFEGRTLALPRQGAFSAKVAPSFAAGAPADVESRDPALAALGAALKRVAAPAAVLPAGPDVSSAIISWRTAVERAKSGAIDASRPSQGPGAARNVATVVFRAQLLRGEPPALLIAARPICGACARDSSAIFDGSGGAIAAPRVSRLLGALASTAAGAMGTSVLYFYLMSVGTVAGSPALAALSQSQTVALALAVSVFVFVPVDAAVGAVLRWRSREAVLAQLPALDAELRRRTLALTILEPLPTSALLALAAATADGRGDATRLTLEEEADADEGAPPEWFEPASGLRSNDVGAALLNALGLTLDARRHAAASARAAAQAAGFAVSGGGGVEGTAVGAPALASLRETFTAATSPTAHTPSATVRVALHLLADSVLAGVASLGAVYCASFALARGSAAASGAAGAWFLGAFFYLFIVHPALLGARTAFAFLTQGVCALRAQPLHAHFALLGAPKAAAAATPGRNAAESAAAAIVAPEILAGAMSAAGIASAHADLRATALAAAYAGLTEFKAAVVMGAGQASAAVAPADILAKGPPPPPSSSSSRAVTTDGSDAASARVSTVETGRSDPRPPGLDIDAPRPALAYPPPPAGSPRSILRSASVMPPSTPRSSGAASAFPRFAPRMGASPLPSAFSIDGLARGAPRLHVAEFKIDNDDDGSVAAAGSSGSGTSVAGGGGGTDFALVAPTTASRRSSSAQPPGRDAPPGRGGLLLAAPRHAGALSYAARASLGVPTGYGGGGSQGAPVPGVAPRPRPPRPGLNLEVVGGLARVPLLGGVAGTARPRPTLPTIGAGAAAARKMLPPRK